MNDFFNLDELNDRTGSNHAGGIVGLLVRLLLALTTAGFFFAYGSQLFAWLVGPEYGAWTAALVGTLAIDGMAFAWPRLREGHAGTEVQMTAASIGTAGNMGISVLITVIFIVLRTTWVTLTAADGSLTAAGWAINLLGLTCMTLAIAGNGALVAYYEYNSAEARNRRARVAMDALRNTAEAQLLRAQMKMTIERTLQDVARQLPDVANRAGEHNSAAFIRERYGYLHDAPRHDDQPPAPTAGQGSGLPSAGSGLPSANGHRPNGNADF
jgi:hypothetical protein